MGTALVRIRLEADYRNRARKELIKGGRCSDLRGGYPDHFYFFPFFLFAFGFWLLAFSFFDGTLFLLTLFVALLLLCSLSIISINPLLYWTGILESLSWPLPQG